MKRKKLKSVSCFDPKSDKMVVKEIVDENGNSINGVIGIQVYKNDLLVYTDKAIYSNNPDIFKTK